MPNTISASLKNYWNSVLEDANKINEKLLTVETTVATKEKFVLKQLEIYLQFLHINDAQLIETLKHTPFYTKIKDCSLNLSKLNTSFKDVDFYNTSSVKTFTATLTTELQEVLNPFFPSTTVHNILGECKKALLLIVKIYQLVATDSTNLAEEAIAISREIVDCVVKIIGLLFNVPPTQLEVLRNVLNSTEAFSKIAANIKKEVVEEEKTHPEISYTEAELQKVSEKLPEIKKELKKIKVPKEINFGELTLEEVFKFVENTVVSKDFDLSSVQKILSFLKDRIEHFFNLLVKIDAHNTKFTTPLATFKNNLLQWLTLPKDFRPENNVEVVHHIVKNIKNSSKNTLKSIGTIGNTIYKNLEKLDVLLGYINNENFKLLITSKQQQEIKGIILPNSMEEAQSLTTESHRSVNTESKVFNKENADTQPQQNVAQEVPKLSISQLLETICLDKKYGAIAKLDKPYAKIIEDLYYKNWSDNHILSLEDMLFKSFNNDAWEKIKKEFKEKVLNKDGVNLGELILFLANHILATLKKGVEKLKDIADYIIKAVFNLIKAILGVFIKVDFPLAEMPKIIKDALTIKKQGNPDVVANLLEVICTIPYTAVKKFIAFDVPDY